MEHHSFRHGDFLEGFLDDENTTDDVDVVVRGYDVDSKDVDGNGDVTNDVERNGDVAGRRANL